MSNQPCPFPPDVSLDEQLACVRRELALRRNTYPRWVASQRMTQEAADLEIRRMQAVTETIERVALLCRSSDLPKPSTPKKEKKLMQTQHPEQPGTTRNPPPRPARPVPEGYLQDAVGRLVPEELVRDVDKLRDQTVRDIVGKAEAASAELGRLKARIFGDIEAFVSLSAERFGVAWGGEKGNIALLSYDGSLKVVLERAEFVVFDERLQIAKSLVDDCLRAWSEGSDPKIRTIVQDAFQVDRTGRVNTRRILGLRRLQIDDPTWKRAMEAIAESLQTVGSKAYVRVYRRKPGTDEWDQIALDISSVAAPQEKTEAAEAA